MNLLFFPARKACGLALLCLATAESKPEGWPVREQDTIRKTMTLAGDPMRLVVDNVEGYVHLTGTAGSQVRVTAHRETRAETDSDLQRAKKEVKLEMTEKPGTVSIYYDAPWRCNGEGRECHGDARHFYSVRYDIDVEAPRNARLVISTVNNGDVQVNGADGPFDIKNVNGGISMTGISNSGDAHTVNGPVAVHFARNPPSASSFKSINGAIDVYLRSGLSADLLFKTMNGQIFTDFDVTARAAPAAAIEQQKGRYVYRSNRMTGGRVGQGGPELSFNTLNGNIRLHREQ
jgi:hypothetical protein